MAKPNEKPTMIDNPAEFVTCDQCDTRRRLPEGCKCKRPVANS